MFFIGPPQWWQPLRKLGWALGLAAAVVASGAAHGKRPVAQPVSESTVALSELPPEAQATHRSILAGGPFKYHKDGVVFGNRERLLPAQPRGFYHEYTVRTPSAADRGARRIVCGGPQRTSPEACFYTADHYASFRRILP